MDLLEKNQEDHLAELQQLKAKVRELEEKQLEAEKVRTEAEVRLRQELDKVDLLALSVDKTGRINFCNDFFLKYTGKSRDHVMGKNWNEIFTYEEHD